MNGYGYNRLEGEARKWAEENKFARSEYCVPVKGGKKFRGPAWAIAKCGDGRLGFSTRRKERDDVRMVVGLEGQFKKKKPTLVRRKSAKAVASRVPRRVDGSRWSLVPSVVIAMASRNPVAVEQQEKADKKLKRTSNRNNRARRGHRRAMRVAT